MEEKKNLEVVTGDNSKFSELDISAVHDNIHPAKPKKDEEDEEDKEDTQNGCGKR